MPTLFGKTYSKRELQERVGDVSQIGGVQPVRLSGGQQDGVEAVEFRTGAGLRFLVVPSRGLDITTADFNGKSLAWRTACGEVAPQFYEEPGVEWLRSFPGGLLTTCGLTYLGAPTVDQDEALGLHGRVSNIPASNVWVDGEWDGDNYIMWVTGKVREFKALVSNVLMQREISAMLGQNKFWIHDTITNDGTSSVPHMILYHMNGGFPAVDAGSMFLAPSVGIEPRDKDAEVGMDQYYLNEAPTPGFKERVYYHNMATDEDGSVYTALINKEQQFGFYIKYNKAELPNFVQWKMNSTQNYVVGMEPSNCRVGGRDKERENGTLQFLEPGETREYNIEVGVLSTHDEIAEIEEIVKSIKG